MTWSVQHQGYSTVRLAGMKIPRQKIRGDDAPDPKTIISMTAARPASQPLSKDEPAAVAVERAGYIHISPLEHRQTSLKVRRGRIFGIFST